MVAEFGNVIDNAVNNKIHLLAERITAEHLPGIEELVPTFRSLMIYYDPLYTSFGELRQRIEALGSISGEAIRKKKRILKIPCCYGARFGLDLRLSLIHI